MCNLTCIFITIIAIILIGGFILETYMVDFFDKDTETEEEFYKKPPVAGSDRFIDQDNKSK